MEKFRFLCAECDSNNTRILDDTIGKCNSCGAFFDLYDVPTIEKVFRTKPKRKYNPEEEED